MRVLGRSIDNLGIRGRAITALSDDRLSIRSYVGFDAEKLWGARNSLEGRIVYLRNLKLRGYK